MQVHTPSQSLILKLRNPERVTQHIPRARVVPVDGVPYTQVKFGLDEARVLRNLGIAAPSPIRYFYDWPIRIPGVPDAKPFDHQVVSAEFFTLNNRCINLSQMGTGKTKAASWAADYLMKLGVTRKAIIVCPKSTMDAVWADEIQNNFLGRRKAVVLNGSRERRLKLLAQDADFYIINHDGLKVIADALAKRSDINLWIYDEASAVRNPQSQRHKLFAKLVKPTDWMWLMTGTPCPKEPTDVWGLAKLLGSKTIPHYFTAFRNDLMIQITQYKWVPKPDAFEKAYAALTPSIRFKKSDCLDLPAVTFTTLMAEMSKEQRDAYEAMKKELVAEVKGVQITAAHAATKLQKLCQISCIEYTTPVLTSRGWVPISEVTPLDLVWDGVEWVTQQGAVYRGYKEVVVVDGVRMTEDHRVLTESGWVEAKDVLNGYASEGFNRVSVRLPNGVEPSRVYHGRDEMRDVVMPLRLRERSGADEPEPTVYPTAERPTLRVSTRESTDNPRVDAHTTAQDMGRHEGALQVSNEQRLGELWRAWDNGLPGVVGLVRGVLGRYAEWVRAALDLGTSGQRRPLQCAELPVGDELTAGQQQADKPNYRDTGRCYDGSQRGQVLRVEADNAVPTAGCGVASGTRDCAPVFDLINCGPRRRFVTQGAQGQTIIVHNCGAVYDAYGDAFYLDASERLGVCAELIEESSNNAIVFVPYTKALDMVAEHLRKAGNIVEVVDGRTSGTERKRIFSEFQSSTEKRVLVAHPATTAHGLTLTKADLTIWYGPIMDLEIFEQANNRMDRPGQKNAMTVACIAANPMELELYSALKNKQAMQNTILAMFKNELGLPNS